MWFSPIIKLVFLCACCCPLNTYGQFIGDAEFHDLTSRITYLHKNGVEHLSNSLRRVATEHPFLQQLVTTGIFGDEQDKTVTSQMLSPHVLCHQASVWTVLGLSAGCTEGLRDYFCSLADWITSVSDDCTKYANESDCSACQQRKQSKLNLKGLWPWKVLDSIGKPPPGIAEMDINWLGDFQTCRTLDAPITNSTRRFKGRYCSMRLGLPTGILLPSIAITPCTATSPTPAQSRRAAMLSSTSKPGLDCRATATTKIKLRIGFCIPDTCSVEDAAIIAKAVFPTSCSVTATCATDDEWSVSGLVAIGFIAFMVFVLFAAGLYDVLVYQVALRKIERRSLSANNGLSSNGASGYNEMKTEMRQNVQYDKRQYYNDLPLWGKITLCFSVVSNGKKLCGTKQSPEMIPCIGGIRFLSFLWVMLGHSYLFGLQYVRNNLALVEFPRQFLFQVVNNGTVSVDTFFTMSGFLLSYLFLKKTRQTHGRQIKSPRFWIMYYVHRYIRLTPLYGAVILLGATIYPNLGSGPFWLKWDAGIVKHCSSKWYLNLLYISNLFGDFNQQCIGWSWYLANDMQFYVFAPVILVLFWLLPVAGLVLSAVVIVASSVLRGYIVYVNDYPPTVMFMASDPHGYWGKTGAFSTEVYEKPWTRLGPFVIGMMLGYILYKTKGKLELNKIVVVVIWLVTFLLTVVVVFGLFDYSKEGELHPVLIMLYAALNRNIWGLAVAVTIYMCAQGYGGVINSVLSWRILAPLSRLTYAAYLLHEFVIFCFYSTMRVTLYGNHTTVLLYFVGFFTVTYGLAAMLSVMFEAPVIQLEKIIFQQSPPPRTPPTTADDQPQKPNRPEALSEKLTTASDVTKEKVPTFVRSSDFPKEPSGVPPGTRL